jgi:argininosuccinate lyase
MSTKKLWSGRFQQNTDEVVEEFTSSIHFDQRLYPYDIKGSMAHARMLGRQGIITEEESAAIQEGLGEILREMERGEFPFAADLEDIHMNVEHRLIEKIGPVGEKLHTTRSRNDQVVLDLRLFLKDHVEKVLSLLKNLQKIIVSLARENIHVVMPGYTHLQRAQPVLFSHHLMAYFEMLSRDQERTEQCLRRITVMPLGSAALAGTSFPVDREFVAQELGFETVSRNSIDAVSDRDFVLDTIFCAAMIMMHLSRFAEELVLWSSEEFSFVEMSDAFTTGSSIMPQKKNPDVAELVRGKTGRIYGDLMAVLTVLKGLPLSYNRDLQEDKESLFDALDTVEACLRVFAALLGEIKINADRMEAATRRGFITATDLADYLVRKGMPFRRAHRLVGEIVAYCIEQKKELHDLSLQELAAFSNLIGDDLIQVMDVKNSINSRTVLGGTATETVLKAVEQAEKEL